MFSLSTRASLTLSRRALSTAPMTASKYPFLARLGIEEHNLGCWDGKEWRGNGNLHTALNPSTGEPIATVQFGNTNDYEVCKLIVARSITSSA
jgi:hypothetical protein